MVASLEKKINPTIIQIIADKCWSGHFLYYAIIERMLVIYCPVCEHFSSISKFGREYVIENYIFLKSEFD